MITISGEGFGTADYNPDREARRHSVHVRPDPSHRAPVPCSARGGLTRRMRLFIPSSTASCYGDPPNCALGGGGSTTTWTSDSSLSCAAPAGMDIGRGLEVAVASQAPPPSVLSGHAASLTPY